MKRLWDMKARLQAFEDRFDASLEELRKRYQRAEQSERDRKKRETRRDPEPDPEVLDQPRRHPAILDLLSRRTAYASDSADSGEG